MDSYLAMTLPYMHLSRTAIERAIRLLETAPPKSCEEGVETGSPGDTECE